VSRIVGIELINDFACSRMIGQTSQITGLLNVLNSLVESGSSRYDLDRLEENDDHTIYHATQSTFEAARDGAFDLIEISQTRTTRFEAV
jgi:hypothetical protein